MKIPKGKFVTEPKKILKISSLLLLELQTCKLEAKKIAKVSRFY